MSQVYRIGVIGTGTIAEGNHIPGFQKQPDARSSPCATRWRSGHVRWRAVMISPACSRVGKSWSRATRSTRSASPRPTCSMRRSLSRAMRAGKHVLCEKPPALNAAQAEEVSRVARETGRTYMACQNLRFNPEIALLRQMISNGELGEVYYAKAGMVRRRGSAGGWFTRKELSGGGALVDIGVHVLDSTRWVMGNPRPVSVMGVTYQKIGSYHLAQHQSWVPAEMRGVRQRASDWAGDVDEMAAAMIRFETGATLSLRGELGAERAQGANLYGDLRHEGRRHARSLTVTTDEHGYLVDKTLKVPGIAYAETHARAIRHFLDCITSWD